MFISKFESVDGNPNAQQVEDWAEEFFHNLLTVMNTFFSYVEVAEAVERMSAIPFGDVIREQLEGESDKIIEIAINKVDELLEMELEFMRAYVEEK
ncbi:MAG: hypothetical protein U9N81_09175 [Bacillota bacterium]|nr:hypothetical protein [Bacillota bacterium]